MIRTEDLSKQFGDFQAVDGINLRVKAGQVLALLGPNGAGKTTTVRMLTSVLAPSRGRAWVGGFDVIEDAPKVRAAVGVLTENHGLYNRMPAREYLDFYGQVYNLDKPARRARTEHLLGKFGLADASQRRIGEYSKGMRQKLALARAMLHSPQVLLLDEPTSAMDPESARLVRDSIQDMRSEERSIIICTHNLLEAEELADHIAIIRRGKIIAYGAPAVLREQFLGASEYEAHLAEPLNGVPLRLPEGANLIEIGENWIRFRVQSARRDNPRVLRALLDQDLAVISLQEVPRSLEQIYLKVMEEHAE